MEQRNYGQEFLSSSNFDMEDEIPIEDLDLEGDEDLEIQNLDDLESSAEDEIVEAIGDEEVAAKSLSSDEPKDGEEEEKPAPEKETKERRRLFMNRTQASIRNRSRLSSRRYEEGTDVEDDIDLEEEAEERMPLRNSRLSSKRLSNDRYNERLSSLRYEDEEEPVDMPEAEEEGEGRRRVFGRQDSPRRDRYDRLAKRSNARFVSADDEIEEEVEVEEEKERRPLFSNRYRSSSMYPKRNDSRFEAEDSEPDDDSDDMPARSYSERNKCGRRYETEVDPEDQQLNDRMSSNRYRSTRRNSEQKLSIAEFIRNKNKANSLREKLSDHRSYSTRELPKRAAIIDKPAHRLERKVDPRQESLSSARKENEAINNLRSKLRVQKLLFTR